MTDTKSNLMSFKGAVAFSLLRPGTIVLITGIIIFAVWQFLVPAKVKIEKQVAVTSGSCVRKPSPSDLLSRNSELQLTRKQGEELEKLVQQEQLEMAPIDAEIESELRQFNKLASGGDLRSLAVVESAAQPMSALGRKKREIEQRCAEQGLRMLDLDQQQKALRLWRSSRARKDFTERAVRSR